MQSRCLEWVERPGVALVTEQRVAGATPRLVRMGEAAETAVEVADQLILRRPRPIKGFHVWSSFCGSVDIPTDRVPGTAPPDPKRVRRCHGDEKTKRTYAFDRNVTAMDCNRCDEEAIMHAAYSGAHLCSDHFRESVEKRVRRRIRRDDLVPHDATPQNPQIWVIGLSGGKDSVVLTQILYETFAEDPRIELVGLTIHEGIDGYRDKSVDACVELSDELGIRHELVSYEEEFGVRMDDVVEDDPENMAACAYCGVFRRDLLSNYATELDADLLLTGHNLDDEAQTALMNVLEGDVEQIAKHFEASLGPLSAREDQDEFVPRAKPLRDVPEKEVALYAHVNDLPAHITECPHASEAYRGEIQQLLYGLEENHPGTRHSILSGYEELAEIAAERYAGDDGADLQECLECGSTTTRDVCRKCSLLESLT